MNKSITLFTLLLFSLYLCCSCSTDATTSSAVMEQQDLMAQQLRDSQELNKKLCFFIIAISVVAGGYVSVFYLTHRYKEAKLQLQKEQLELEAERAKRLILELKLKEENRKSILQELKLSTPVLRFRKALLDVQPVHDIDWQALYAAFNEMLPSFEQVLKSRYPLSESELQVCLLLKLDFAPGDIALLTNKTKASISLMRTRLYSKFFQQEGTAKDFDDYIRSI